MRRCDGRTPYANAYVESWYSTLATIPTNLHSQGSAAGRATISDTLRTHDHAGPWDSGQARNDSLAKFAHLSEVGDLVPGSVLSAPPLDPSPASASHSSSQVQSSSSCRKVICSTKGSQS